jgi:surface antigen
MKSCGQTNRNICRQMIGVLAAIGSMALPISGLAGECDKYPDPSGFEVGQCVWYVRQRVPNIPWSGDAKRWNDLAKQNGWSVVRDKPTPRVGAIAVFDVGKFGHVAYIEEVGANGRFRVSHCNWGPEKAGRPKHEFNCWGWTEARCKSVGDATSKWVAANGQFENSSSSARLSGIIYPPNLKVAPTVPTQTPQPIQTRPNPAPKKQAVPQYAIRIFNVDVPAEASINGRVVARVNARGDTGTVPINNMLHSRDNKVRFKLGNESRPHTYHFVLLENGQVKWDKKCGQVDRTPCQEKLKNGEKSITLNP